jgi:hypothetical protein
MIFLLSLLPTTAFVVVGYFLVYTSTRAEGALKRFGQYLGVWVFFLAGVTILGGLFASTLGIRGPMGDLMEHMERMQNTEDAILQELQRD